MRTITSFLASVLCSFFISQAMADTAPLPTLSDWDALLKTGSYDTLVQNNLRQIANGSLSGDRLKLYLNSTITQLSAIQENLQKETDPKKKQEIQGYINEAKISYLMYSGQYPDALKDQYKKEWEAQKAAKANKDSETLKNLVLPDANTSWADLLKMYKGLFPSAKVPVQFAAGSTIYNKMQDALTQSATDQKKTAASLIDSAQKTYKDAATIDNNMLRKSHLQGIAFAYFMVAHALLGHADQGFLSANKLSYSVANGLKAG